MFDDVGEEGARRLEIFAQRRRVSEKAPRSGKDFHVTSSLTTQILIKTLVKMRSGSQRNRKKRKGARRPFNCFFRKDFS
jgi:hypothetical protein